jgi:hypothetical protein
MIDLLDSRLQMPLDHSTELERLACSDLERPVPMLVRKLVHIQPLAGRAHASGHAHTGHEAERRR